MASVDVVRGAAMVIMALDHTRHFFSHEAALFEPTDLAQTTPVFFFTRWITHFCAPVFVFLAGSGAYLSLSRGKTPAQLSRFLASRGLWLIFLEIFVISPLGWEFSFSFGLTHLQVIWAIGVSMIVLGGMVRVLTSRAIGVVGLAMILLHDLSDGHAAWPGAGADSWHLLHQTTTLHLGPHHAILSFYPLIPWTGVMMAGFAAGECMTFAKDRRRRTLLLLGGCMSALFIVLRTWNLYGDPSPWSMQKGMLRSLMSFLRCSKYPPSLLFLLMTLGPALIAMALLDGKTYWLLDRLRTFGRVPLFYYLLHLPLLHSLAILFSFALYGDTSAVCAEIAAHQMPFPLSAHCGYNIFVVYTIWIVAVCLLYPLCKWFAGVKQRRPEAIFTYL